MRRSHKRSARRSKNVTKRTVKSDPQEEAVSGTGDKPHYKNIAFYRDTKSNSFSGKVKNMKSYGYEVQGNADALRDVTETMNDSKRRINWNNFKTGDFYWTGNGDRYKVEIDHEAKKVILIEE